LHSKQKASTHLPVADREYYRKQVAYRISYRKLTTPEFPKFPNPETRIVNSILQTKLKNNDAMITTANKGNSIVILPIQEYETTIQNFLNKNNFRTSTAVPTKTFQNQIRKTGHF
jgi:hypothetical protein